MHVSFALESYMASRSYVRDAAALLKEHFTDFSLHIEGDLPPHGTFEDLLASADFLTEEGIDFILDGPTMMLSTERPARRRCLRPDELSRLVACAGEGFRAVRIHAITPYFHHKPKRFYEVFDFCHRSSIRLQIVVGRTEWDDGGWSDAHRRRMPRETTVLHASPVFGPSNPPAFIITGSRGDRFDAVGYSLELGRAFPSTEAETEAVLTALERQRIAGPAELHVYPIDAVIDNPVGRLPSNLHAWPELEVDSLYPAGSRLALTPFGAVLASRIAGWRNE